MENYEKLQGNHGKLHGNFGKIYEENHEKLYGIILLRFLKELW